MGFFEKIFGPKKPREAEQSASKRFEFLEGYTPAFRSFNGSIYESELIRAAIDAHGRHAAKLKPIIEGSAKPNLRSRLAIMPNPWQTWPQYLYRLTTILYCRNTAFTVPIFGEYGEINGIMPISPTSWDLVEYKGEPYIRFLMDKGRRIAIELSHVSILTRYQYRNELFGENNDALRSTLDLIEIQRQGIKDGVKNHATYKFYAINNNWSLDEDLAKERQRFDNYNFRGDSGGVLLFPNSYKDVKQISPSQYTVNADEAKMIKDNVFDYFAVNEDVIQNKAIGDSWLAFYEGAIEWMAINLSDSLTRMLFTERERQFGNQVFFTANRLQYMSTKDKLEMVTQTADRGLMTINELREILNLAPLPEPLGSRIPARGEYYAINEEAERNAADNQ